MEFYLFDYQITIGWQEMFFFLSGSFIVSIALYVFAPDIEKRQRAKRISQGKQIKSLRNSVCSLQDELYYFRNRYMSALETFKKMDKQTQELNETIITLSLEKDKILTDKKLMEVERNHYYIEVDRLKAEIRKIIHKEYSGKYISEEGRIE